MQHCIHCGLSSGRGLYWRLSAYGHKTAAPGGHWQCIASLHYLLITQHMAERWAKENICARWLSQYDYVVCPAELQVYMY